MIRIKSATKNYAINVPTSFDEITKDFFEGITKNVNLPKHHCIVAMCTKAKLFDFMTATSSSTQTMATLIPYLACIRKDDNENLNAEIGEKIIIDRTSLERGVHLNLPCCISASNFYKYVESDKNLVGKIRTGQYTIDKDGIKVSPEICIVEFKIVPVVSISATIKNDVECIDVFKSNED